MRSRRLNKRIEIWQTAKVADGFGGSTVSETLITSSWCEIKTYNKVTNGDSIGIKNPTNTVMFKLRLRNDITYNSINQFIKYRNEKYIILNQPFNVNFRDKTIEILAIKQAPNNVSELNPI